jgi:hypothetical protein
MAADDGACEILDRKIAALAGVQEGVVGATQLNALGLGRHGVRHRLDVGRLHELFTSVYAVGHPSVSADGRRIGAVLACGEGAVLSRFSAAEAWGILGGSRKMYDVVAPGRSGGRIGDADKIDLRRTRRLPAEDVTMLRGIPITTVARVLLDLSGCTSPRTVQHAVHEAEVIGLLDVEEVIATIERNPGRRGTRTLRAAIGVRAPDPGNSVFAIMFLKLCADHGLPTPQLGVHVDGGDRLYEADALFDAERLVVELDGGQVHRTARNFQTDRRRDSVLAARDYQTLRYTWHRVRDEPKAVATELRRVLALRALRAA